MNEQTIKNWIELAFCFIGLMLLLLIMLFVGIGNVKKDIERRLIAMDMRTVRIKDQKTGIENIYIWDGMVVLNNGEAFLPQYKRIK